jgi:hypothetical protein
MNRVKGIWLISLVWSILKVTNDAELSILTVYVIEGPNDVS